MTTSRNEKMIAPPISATVTPRIRNRRPYSKAISFEAANPRHAHEWTLFERVKLPEGKVLIPGVVDSTNNYIEHPEVVARRIEEAVAAVGDRERVIASTDCGFGTFAGREWVAEDVVWAKLAALREGADLASQRLWGRSR